MRHEKQSNVKTLWGGVIFWPLFSLTVTPFVLATPAHASDDNTVSIAVDQNAALKPSGTLYKATTNVTVKTDKPYGFNLTMQADTADLINSKDSTHKISATPSSTPVALNANQWGYSLNKSATTFSAVPAGAQATPAVIADVTKAKPAGCTNPASCTKSVTFAANVDPAKLASGSYSTAITYTATAKPKPAPTVDPTTCKSGDPKNDCQVDLDPNMIPVKYMGSTTNAQWTSLANPEDNSNQGNWYNYNNKQWANAVTVKDPSKYKGKNTVVEQADILGYWVYIPRYAYEVMRRDGTDSPVPAQNFLISFEKTTTPKRHPAACSITGKDYRTQCDLNRDYIKGQPSNQGTWATHPAFTFGSKELNGIWFAKFETTGDVKQPTVLPNSLHLSGNSSGINSRIGGFYSVAKSLGVDDPQNVGGDSVSSPQNSHHLAKLSSHMVNSNDWGAATYLSASKYGAGYNGVQINSQNQSQNNSYSVTGCGPRASGNTSTYNNGGTLGTQQACSSSDPQRAYNGALGQLASTTNSPTGIYDMSGGAWEYTAGTYTTNLNESGVSSEYGDYFGAKAHPPYVNTYNFSAPNGCTFATCGGQALYETLGWNGQNTDSLSSKWVWFDRGYSAADGSRAGVFALDSGTGYTNIGSDAFRVALAPAPDPPTPPTPKYTTNGCGADYDQHYNCAIAGGNLFGDAVARSGGEWAASNSYIYDYGKGVWPYNAPMDGSYVARDGSYPVVYTYVPRFSKKGNDIRFCSNDFSYGCSDNEVDSTFRGSRKYGFWISLADLGCKNVSRGNIASSYGSAIYNDGKYAAKILIDAFGSPCPK